MALSPQYDDPLFAAATQPACIPVAEAVRQACSAIDPALPADLVAIVRVLTDHVGEAAAIPAPEIADRAGLYQTLGRANRGTKVRHLLSITLDHLPWPLCGDSAGYYFAGTAAELTHYFANLRSREIEHFRRERTTRHAAMRTGRFVHLGHGRWADRPTDAPPSAASAAPRSDSPSARKEAPISSK